MKRLNAVPTTVPNVIRNLFVGLLMLVPFHALLTVFGAKLVGNYTLLRLWPEIILFVLLIWFVAAAVRDAAFRDWLKHDKLFWLIVAYIVWSAIMAAAGIKFGNATALAAAQGLIINGRIVLALLIGFVLTFYRPSILRHCPRYVLAPAAVVVAFGLLQTFVLPADFLTQFGYGPATIPAIETVDQKAGFERIQSTLRGANPLGAYLTIVVATCLVALLRIKKYRGWVLALLIGSLVLLVYTYSRSAYLGAVIALLAAGFWLAQRRRLILGITAVLTVCFGFGLFLLRDNDRVQNTFFHTDEKSMSSQSSNDVRRQAWASGLYDVAHEPLGRGVGTAGPASANNTGHPTRIAENYFLQIGQETGWVGLGLFLAINFVAMFRLWRLKDQPMTTALLAAFIGLTVINFLLHGWADETVGILFWGLAGIAVGASAILTAESTKQQHVETETE